MPSAPAATAAATSPGAAMLAVIFTATPSRVTAGWPARARAAADSRAFLARRASDARSTEAGGSTVIVPDSPIQHQHGALGDTQ